MKDSNASALRFACRFLIAILMLGAGAASLAAEHYVATNGKDEATCGPSGRPCRSISQALTNAVNGDTIWVRAGIYGDLNDDGAFDDPGDEQPDPSFSCMICVLKDVDILSVDGAELTVISSGDENVLSVPNAVLLRADGATLGATGHGFTVRGGANQGILVTGGRNARVVGNIVQMRGGGIEVGVCNGPIYVLENVVSRGQLDGFKFYTIFAIGPVTCTEKGPLVVRDNVASDIFSSGFTVESVSGEFRRNIATRNISGAVITGPISVTDSSFIGNRDSGVRVINGGSTFLRNTIAGNQGAGVLVVANPGAARVVTLHQNNIFGNGITGGITQEPGPAGINCGVFSEVATAINAEQNFWGAASGPGADPADKAGPGSGCDSAGGVTQVLPFATQRFPVLP